MTLSTFISEPPCPTAPSTSRDHHFIATPDGWRCEYCGAESEGTPMTTNLTPEEVRDRSFWDAIRNDEELANARRRLSFHELRRIYMHAVRSVSALLQTASDTHDELAKAKARLAEYEGAVGGLLSIIDESEGIQGWHRNGDTADWSEFEDVARLRALQEKK